jgi:hypothetical protein
VGKRGNCFTFIEIKYEKLMRKKLRTPQLNYGGIVNKQCFARTITKWMPPSDGQNGINRRGNTSIEHSGKCALCVVTEKLAHIPTIARLDYRSNPYSYTDYCSDFSSSDDLYAVMKQYNKNFASHCVALGALKSSFSDYTVKIAEKTSIFLNFILPFFLFIAVSKKLLFVKNYGNYVFNLNCVYHRRSNFPRPNNMSLKHGIQAKPAINGDKIIPELIVIVKKLLRIINKSSYDELIICCSKWFGAATSLIPDWVREIIIPFYSQLHVSAFVIDSFFLHSYNFPQNLRDIDCDAAISYKMIDKMGISGVFPKEYG